MFADKPRFVSRQMLLTFVSDPLRRSVGYADTDSSEAGFELALCPGSPAHTLLLGIGQHVFGRYRQNIWHMPRTWTAARSNRPDQPHADRIHLEVTRDADRLGKLASREPLAKRRAQRVTGIRQHTAEAHTGRDHAIDLRERDIRLGPCRAVFDRNARSL